MSAETVQAAVAERFPTGDAPIGGNEFVIFSKPELGRLGDADLAAVWDLFAAAFAQHGVTVHDVSIATGAQLESSGWMAQHYGVINQISTGGRAALTAGAEAALVEQYGDALDDAEVLGGHQFLDRYPEFSPFSLAMLFSNASVSRLGPGTYGGQVSIDGTKVIILNGFHPRQLAFFTADDTVCAFLHASSDTAWETLRSELIGATDPAKAAGSSLRGTLKADPAAYGLTAVNSNFNGVHMSAGPLEGLVELGRFFADLKGGDDWKFAADLAAAGADPARIAELRENPVIETPDGGSETAFDLTEGVDSAEAARLLV